MAKMNLAIHGLNGKLASRWGDTFARDLHPDLQADFIMANPPFNIKDWARSETDPRWKYGVPPTSNANYAWIQHILSKLAPGGSAGVVMANGSMSTNSGGEGDIRAQIVEADMVSCMVALPTQLFRSTGIPVCVWFFAKDKSAGSGGSIDRTGQVLFIDARNLGHMIDRAERALGDEDIARIADTYREWRGRPAGRVASASESVETSYADEPGFCYTATLAEIKAADYALTPGRYVGVARTEEDAEPIEARVARLTSQLFAQFEQSEELGADVRRQLGRVSNDV
jgi:type I restriction enzyme M protein